MKGELHPAFIVRCAAWLYVAHILFLGKIALLELSAFWCGFYLCWAIVRREAKASFHVLYFPLLAYAVATTVSAIANSNAAEAYGDGIIWFKVLIFPVALIVLRQVPKLRERLPYVYAIFGSGIACWGLIEYVFQGKHDLEHRINGPVSHVMTFSGLLLVMALVFLVLWYHQRRVWQLATALIATFALMLTYTRSAWLGWMAGVLVLIAFANRARRFAYVLAPAAVLLVTFLPLPIFGRLISTFDFKQTSNFDRIRMAEAGVEMIRDSPVLGVGPGNVKAEYALYRKQDAPRSRPPHLHNNVIQLWAERGILGLAAYVTFLGLFVRACARAWNGPARMWSQMGIAVTVALAIAGLFEFNFGDTEVFFLMMNVSAWVIASIETNSDAAAVVRADGV